LVVRGHDAFRRHPGGELSEFFDLIAFDDIEPLLRD